MTETVPPKAHPPAATLRGSSTGYAAIPGTRFEMRENGLLAASRGAYTARHFRVIEGGAVEQDMHWHDAEFQYVHVLKGEIEFELQDNEIKTLGQGDAIWLPRGCLHRVTRVSADLEFLEIFSPAEVATVPARE